MPQKTYFYKELRQKAKQANQRMVRLEKEGIKSPAYQAAQAKLEMLGKRSTKGGGRRFSETGKATYNEMEMMSKILDDFLNDNKTSTVKGARDYYDSVWEGANKNNKLAEAGITKEEWFDFWESMPDKKDRVYGSEQIVAMVRAYKNKDGELEDSDKMSMAEIAEEIEASRNLKSAYKSLGLSAEEVANARPLKA